MEEKRKPEEIYESGAWAGFWIGGFLMWILAYFVFPVVCKI